MNKKLRKRHLQIWICWALLLPSGIVMAWLAIPSQQPVKLIQAEAIEPLPVLVQSADKRNYWVNLRSDIGKKAWQLEWINKFESEVPSAVIYRTHNNNLEAEKAELIGRIETKGSYRFPLREIKEGEVLFLYDFIHEKVIDTIRFKTGREGK